MSLNPILGMEVLEKLTAASVYELQCLEFWQKSFQFYPLMFNRMYCHTHSLIFSCWPLLLLLLYQNILSSSQGTWETELWKSCSSTLCLICSCKVTYAHFPFTRTFTPTSGVQCVAGAVYAHWGGLSPCLLHQWQKQLQWDPKISSADSQS